MRRGLLVMVVVSLLVSGFSAGLAASDGGMLAAAPTFLWQQEAEDGSRSAPMLIGQDSGASNCYYVYTETRDQGAVTCSLSVPQATYYYVWARARGANEWENSFFFSIDGGSEGQFEIHPWDGQWNWVRVHWEGQSEGPYYLSAGSHTLSFRGREPNAQLDALLVTDSSSYVPSGPLSGCGVTPTPTRTPTSLPQTGCYTYQVVPFSWIDISSSGTVVAQGDDTYTQVSLGFAFPFCGTYYTDAFVCSNGFVSFGAGYTHYANTAIPTTDAPNNAIYAFWDDLNPAGGENGNVYVRQIDANRYVIQWQRVKLLYASDLETFEIVLNRSDGTILLQYLSVANTGSATVGIEEAGGASATQYCFNTPDCVSNGLALLFTPRAQPPRPVVSPSSFNISLVQGESTSRQMTIGNQGQAELSFSIRDIMTSLMLAGATQTFQLGLAPAVTSTPTAPPVFIERHSTGIFRDFASDTSGLSLVSPPLDIPAAEILATGNVLRRWSSGLSAAWGIAYDSRAGTIWVGCPASSWGGNSTIYEYTLSGTRTGRSHLFNWNPAYGPADLTYDRNTGMLWVMGVEEGGSCIYEINPASGYTGRRICPGFPFSQRGLAHDPTTSTFFAGGWGDCTIYRFDESGSFSAQVRVDLPISGLAYNSITQHLFVIANAETDSNLVYVLDAANNFRRLGQFRISEGFGSYAGAGLDFDCEGKLWAVDQQTETVYQFESGEEGAICRGDAAWLTYSPSSGTVAPGGQRNVTVYFNASGLAAGTYNANLLVSHNDGSPNPIVVPVTLIVSPVSPTPSRTPSTYLVATNTPTCTHTPGPVRLPVILRHRVLLEELKYDDGVRDRGALATEAGFAMEVRFNISQHRQVLRLKYYVYQLGNPVRLYVRNASGDLYSREVTPSVSGGEGWFERDVAGENIFVQGEFRVGFETRAGGGPALGVDQTLPIDLQSFAGPMPPPAFEQGDLMIRVVVQ